MLTRAEALLASATAILALAILSAYVPYRIGWRVFPLGVLVVTFGAGGAIGRRLVRTSAPPDGATAAAVAVVAGVAGYFFWIARPDFLPLGGGPDLAHHLVLIDYIERAWRLV